ncbi:MAG: hypothetical protein ABR500_09580 [Dermatophilaceae bacterium]|nr:hypothetical protein [Intrasporangiaceae bacterium]
MTGGVLVLATGRSRGTLAAVRELGETGWRVGFGTPGDPLMVGASRHVGRIHPVARPRGDGTEFLTSVRQAVTEGRYDLVVGGADDWMAALAHYRDDIPCVVPHPSAEVVERVLDKGSLAGYAHRNGLRAPRTVPATWGEAQRWEGPAIVKCRSHWRPGQEQELRIEARFCESREVIEQQIALIEKAGLDAVIQEPVAGELCALIGVVTDGRLTGRVQQRSPRLWPTPCGVSARAVTETVDEDLAARCEGLLKDVGWTGLVELQFLRVAAEEDPLLIDFNGRFFGSMGLSTAARPGLIDGWLSMALGRPAPDLEDAPAGVRFAWGAGDVRRALVERRGGVVADVWDTWSWSRGARTGVWSARDPGPALRLASGRLRGREGAPQTAPQLSDAR